MEGSIRCYTEPVLVTNVIKSVSQNHALAYVYVLHIKKEFLSLICSTISKQSACNCCELFNRLVKSVRKVVHFEPSLYFLFQGNIIS